MQDIIPTFLKKGQWSSFPSTKSRQLCTVSIIILTGNRWHLLRVKLKIFQWRDYLLRCRQKFLKSQQKMMSYPETSHSRKPLLPWGLKGWRKRTVSPEPSESWRWQKLDLGQTQPLPEPWWGRQGVGLTITFPSPPSCMNPTGNQRARGPAYCNW